MNNKKYLHEFLLNLKDHDYGFKNKIDINSRSTLGDSPAKYAVTRSDHRALVCLIESGADMNIQGEDGYTPLHHACSRKDIYMIKLLLSADSDYTIEDFYGKRPIDYLYEQKLQTVKQFLTEEKKNRPLE